MRITTQLYTVRDQIAADTFGTLKTLASFGLEYIELGGQSVEQAKEWKGMLDEVGLKVSGAHYGLGFMDKMDEVYEAMNIFECKTIINPWDQLSIFTTKEGTLGYAEKLQQAGNAITTAGFEYLYHNHDFEFYNVFDGVCAWELLVQNTDAKCVNYELDIAWVKVGGADEVDMMTRYADRIKVLHLKDVDLSQTPKWRIAGTGTVNLDFALDFGTKHGISFGAIELDESPIAPLDAVQQSFEFFKSKGYK
jgi:sugar phosphate isomerase/epimerase